MGDLIGLRRHLRVAVLMGLAGAIGVAACSWFGSALKMRLRDKPGGDMDPCRLPEDIISRGDVFVEPSFHGPPPDVPDIFWDGSRMALALPDPRTYVRCRPCTSNEAGELEPWDPWEAMNTRAYERLRLEQAPYPVAIVPGHHSMRLAPRRRLNGALNLIQQGWVAALILTGGHRRGGHNEALAMVRQVQSLAQKRGVDLTDRIFVEPCANKSITNLRNALRMMAAFGLDRGLLVTDTHLTGQAFVFNNALQVLVPKVLGCPVGRVSHLLGDGPIPRSDDEHPSGCQPPLTWRSNPVGFLAPGTFLAVFWVSPYSYRNGKHSALECQGGSADLIALEPDNEDPFTAACLPTVGDEAEE